MRACGPLSTSPTAARRPSASSPRCWKRQPRTSSWGVGRADNSPMSISLTDDQPTIDVTGRPLTWERIGAGAGILAVLLLGFAFIVMPTPGTLDPRSPGPLVSQYLVDGRSQARVSMYLLILGAAFLVVFVAHLRRVVEGVEQGRSWTAAVVYGGGLTAAAGAMIFA